MSAPPTEVYKIYGILRGRAIVEGSLRPRIERRSPTSDDLAIAEESLELAAWLAKRFRLPASFIKNMDVMSETAQADDGRT